MISKRNSSIEDESEKHNQSNPLSTTQSNEEIQSATTSITTTTTTSTPSTTAANPQPPTNSSLSNMANTSNALSSTEQNANTTSTNLSSSTNAISKPKPRESLANLLKKFDLQLNEVLDEDVRSEFLREFRNKNQKLVQFLGKRENVSKLIDMLLNEETANMFIFEILTADQPIIQGWSKKYFLDLIMSKKKIKNQNRNV